MKINIKKLNENAIIPTKKSEEAAGYDLCANITKSLTINPHETVEVGTGLAIELPVGCFGGIFARSGIATERGLRPSNCIGVCDSDYRGEYIVALHNDTDIPQTIEPNERIAQLIIMPFLQIKFNEVVELSKTKRGTNGFGSTGKN